MSLHVSLAGLLNHKGLLGIWEPASDDFCLTLVLPSPSLSHVILKQQSPFHCAIQLFKWVPQHLSEGVGLTAGWAGRRWLNKNRKNKGGNKRGEKISVVFPGRPVYGEVRTESEDSQIRIRPLALPSLDMLP